MASASAGVDSTLPILPPVPSGPQPFFRARGLAALIAALDDAIISYQGPHGDAIVVVVGGRVLDAVAAPSGRSPLIGLEALNALGPADHSALRAAAVDRRLALSMPSYWREPDRLPPIPARWLDGAVLIEAMVRPRHRGVVILRSPSDLGVVFFDESGLVAAYSQGRPEPGGLETLAGIMTDPETTIHARVADGSGQPTSYPAESTVAALPDPIERCRAEILEIARSTLHMHADPVMARFRAAPGTAAGLRLAAEEVRGLRLRLVSRSTLDGIAERAEELLRAASRAS